MTIEKFVKNTSRVLALVLLTGFAIETVQYVIMFSNSVVAKGGFNWVGFSNRVIYTQSLYSAFTILIFTSVFYKILVPSKSELSFNSEGLSVATWLIIGVYSISYVIYGLVQNIGGTYGKMASKSIHGAVLSYSLVIVGAIFAIICLYVVRSKALSLTPLE